MPYVQQTANYPRLLLSWHTSNNTNPLTYFKYFSMTRPITAWSMNQRDQSREASPISNKAICLWLLFLVCKAVYHYLLSVLALTTCMHTYVLSHSNLSIWVMFCFLFFSIAQRFHWHWHQHIIPDLRLFRKKLKTNCRSTLLIINNKCMYLTCRADSLLCSLILLFIIKSCCVLRR